MDIDVKRSVNCTGEAHLEMDTAMVRSMEWTVHKTHLQIESIPKKGRINWTEKARGQLLEAVIKVEKDILDASKHVSGSSASKQTREWSTTEKWDAILNLLPAELQERTWNRNKKKYNVPRCKAMFDNLRKGYRDKLAGKRSRPSRRPKFTEPVFRMLMRWDDVVNGRGSTVPAKSSSRPETSKSLDTAKSSQDDEQHQSQCGMRPEGKSASSVREEGTAESLQHRDKLQTTEDDWNFDVKLERKEGTSVDDDKFMTTARVETTPPSRSVDESISASISAPPSVVQTRAQLAAQTRRQARPERIAHIAGSSSATRRPSIECQAPLPNRRCKAGKIQKISDQEHLQAMMKRSLRKLDLEFLCLSSWVQNEAIPVGQSVSKEIISSEMRSGDARMNSSAHRSGTVIERFDQLVQKSLERSIDNQIQASFFKLQTRFLMDLKETAVGVAKEVVKETQFLKSIPS